MTTEITTIYDIIKNNINVRDNIQHIKLNQCEIKTLSILYVTRFDTAHTYYDDEQILLLEKHINEYTFWELFVQPLRVCYDISFDFIDTDVEIPKISKTTYQFINTLATDDIELLLFNYLMQTTYDEYIDEIDILKVYDYLVELRNHIKSRYYWKSFYGNDKIKELEYVFKTYCLRNKYPRCPKCMQYVN